MAKITSIRKDGEPSAYLRQKAKGWQDYNRLYVAFGHNGPVGLSFHSSEWAMDGLSGLVRPSTLRKMLESKLLIRRSRAVTPPLPGRVYAYCLNPKYQ